MGESAPWVVEDELVKKFNLPSKFSDFLLDPHKVIHSWYFLCVAQFQSVSSSWLTFVCLSKVFSRESFCEAQKLDLSRR